jgi:hypothetical protein
MRAFQQALVQLVVQQEQVLVRVAQVAQVACLQLQRQPRQPQFQAPSG